VALSQLPIITSHCEKQNKLPYQVDLTSCQSPFKFIIVHFSFCIYLPSFLSQKSFEYNVVVQTLWMHDINEIFEMDVWSMLFLSLKRVTMMFSSKKHFGYKKIGPMRNGVDT
jgi:hypothetical protein